MTTEELLCAVKGRVILEAVTTHHEGRGERSVDKWRMSDLSCGKNIIEKLKRSPSINHEKVLSSNSEIIEPENGFTVVRSFVARDKE